MNTDRTMLTASSVMQRNVYAVGLDTPVLDAIGKLLAKGFSGAPVVDGRTILGLFSERDGLAAIAAAHYEGEPPGVVAQHMRRAFVVVHEQTDLYEVATVFRNNPIRRLPVVDDQGLLSGIISRGDVLKALRQLYSTREKTGYEKLQEHMDKL
jgi:CBS domain-containing protein